ncbi:hypothetical protein HanRHA438_Chr09g0407241 [Helianthus annuus]|nr:hypothetical protein HanRHA438_Chr09g0407241 [Helianthus annuus]
MSTTTDLNVNSITIATEKRSSNFSECSAPTFIYDQGECTQINVHGDSIGRTRKWKKLMKSFVEESRKSLYRSSKPMVFRYDAVSYMLNFDDGHHSDEYYLYGSRCS